MGTILYVAASPRSTDAHSRRFGAMVVDRLQAGRPQSLVVTRDLAADPLPHVSEAFSAAILSPPIADHPDLELSEALIRELEEADCVVIATPMHNFTVPAALKAWIDHIVRIHRTFTSTPAGKVGKLPDRPIYLVVASGGWFTQPAPTGAPPQPDFLTPYLRTILATIGLHTVTVFPLEGVTRGPEAVDAAFRRASAALEVVLPAA